MIEVIDKTKCCGCGSCFQKCPRNCISMELDDEGFLYPVVNLDRCINCKLCEIVCPSLHGEEEKVPLIVYAATSRDENLRRVSSSGGIFSLLANRILESGGIVVGAAFTEDWQVKMICISDKHELWKLRGSKYVQADVGSSFRETEKYLKEGREVLYSGTPCQIKALKLYLRKNFDNLFTVDIACHGVPSPGVWSSYLQELLEMVHNNNNRNVKSNTLDVLRIKNVNFREKSEGWRKYHLVFDIVESKNGNDKVTQLSFVHYENPYFNAFNYNLIIRPSCSNCPAKYGKSLSDITIGDFWGIENVVPLLDDDKGSSLVLINTEKGRSLFNQLDVNRVQCSYEEVLKYNTGLRENARYHLMRQKFFLKFKNKKMVTKYMSSFLTISFIQRIIKFIKRKF